MRIPLEGNNEGGSSLYRFYRSPDPGNLGTAAVGHELSAPMSLAGTWNAQWNPPDSETKGKFVKEVEANV